MDKGLNRKQEPEKAPLSFEHYSKDAQQYLLRGLAQQIGALAMPQLGIIQEMFAKAGLRVITADEARKTDTLHHNKSKRLTHDNTIKREA